MNVLEQLQICIDCVNNMLRQFINLQPLQNTILIQAMYDSVLLGGKRLRPLLVYATGKMFNVNSTVLYTLAAAIECIHAYSLIHDDLPSMDNDNLRRGLPTCHIKFGEANAILAGNALHALAFSILSNVPMYKVTKQDRIAIIYELASASGVAGICGGQALDLEVQDQYVNLEQLEYIYRHKTGALIKAAVRLGALSAGRIGRSVMSELDYYADNIGLAFQIQDDILDIHNNTTVSDKLYNTTNQKLKKRTYPDLLGIEQAKHKAQCLIHEAQQVLLQLTTQSLDTSVLAALADYIIQRNQ